MKGTFFLKITSTLAPSIFKEPRPQFRQKLHPSRGPGRHVTMILASNGAQSLGLDQEPIPRSS